MNRLALRGRGVALVTLALLLVAGAATAAAEDATTQREMAASYAQHTGLSVEAAQAQLDRQDRLVQVADQIRNALGDAYAGIWFDNADGGRMKIGVSAATSTALLQSMQGILAANDASTDADLVRVGATHAQLAAEQDKLNAALAEQLQAGQVSTAIDPTTNTVLVRVASTLPASAQANIQQTVANTAPDVRVEASEDVSASFGTCVARSGDNALFCGNPFRGAVRIGVGTIFCSSGFVTLSNSDSKPYVLTAGHCLQDGGTGTWASRDASLTLHDLGARHSWTLGSGGDYGIITMSTAYWSTSPYVVYDGASTWNETYHIYDAGTSYVGMPICASGSVLLGNGHYSDCDYVSALDVTTNVDGIVVQHLGEASTCNGASGESGGPYYKDGHAYGLFSAYSSACNTYYQEANGALSGSNVHLPG